MLDKQMVKAAARGRWEEIFRALAPVLDKAIDASPRHAPRCPMPAHRARGNDHGRAKFRLPQDFRENGRGICTCGNWTDGFALLMALNGWSFADCLSKVGDFLGLTLKKETVVSTDRSETVKTEGKLLFAGFRKTRYETVYCVRIHPKGGTASVTLYGSLLENAVRASQAKVGDNVSVVLCGIQTCRNARGAEFRRKLWAVTRLPSDEEIRREAEEANLRTEECRKKISSLWDSSDALDSESENAKQVCEYLTRRGLAHLSKEHLKDLRAARLIYRKTETAPSEWFGLVAAVRDVNGNLVCIHRTFLDKGKKAAVETPKMLMSLGPGDSVNGCSIHIGEPTDVLCVAEGIETAASVAIGTGFPCWSCISANGLKAVQIPDSVKLVFIFEDKDRSGTGQKAAAYLQQRLTKEGRIAAICSISRAIPADSKGVDWNDILCDPQGDVFPVKNPNI